MDASFKLGKADSRFPLALTICLGDLAPDTLSVLGNLEILQRKPLALFCSVRCPGNLIVQTYDLAHKLRRAGVTVMGGFHSPMERRCLDILLRSPHPVILCPARSLPKRVPSEFRQPLEEGRLLLLSPFSEVVNRSEELTAGQRNRFVAALADKIFAAYAAPNSHTERFCREIVAWQKPLYTFAGEANENLLLLGAKPIDPADLAWAQSG